MANDNSLKLAKEWLRQSDYDIETAEFMFDGGKYFYAVFMCHLSIEKALKGMYKHIFKDVPPKTHNLIYLIEKIKIDIPGELYDFVFILNRVSVPTRYPDDLKKIMKDYNKQKVKEILKKSKDLLKWLKTKF
ncbi:MAG: DNA-binding protein [Elusimicrobia bacterium CG1_02_37_114]|nr:MAG: DNA-binding protein [Elusimicrobia bacterium CG1_02_37_114]PIV53072.1 MAG: DNA-binding protein [Elusimicrobia bacterium CG02_land_8_20_14_3_00_37_13]PIZ12755.1 MAG: DNA-binding protein [Elusimicrobia bacterium CG_4_10_14_0_8_um_filter_37_32]